MAGECRLDRGWLVLIIWWYVQWSSCERSHRDGGAACAGRELVDVNAGLREVIAAKDRQIASLEQRIGEWGWVLEAIFLPWVRQLLYQVQVDETLARAAGWLEYVHVVDTGHLTGPSDFAIVQSYLSTTTTSGNSTPSTSSPNSSPISPGYHQHPSLLNNYDSGVRNSLNYRGNVERVRPGGI